MRKLLLVQFNSSMLTQDEDTQAKAYYDKLYRTQPGYHRYGPTWEIPGWMAEMAYNFPEADVMFADTMADIFDKMQDYDDLAFSALDCNKHLIKTVACNFKGDVFVGGYCDRGYFTHIPNIIWCGSIWEMCLWYPVNYKPGVDYRHFAGAKTIARLTMSKGCSNRCKFCVVPNGAEPISMDVVAQQLYAIKRLDSPLIYIGDKTFGQVPNSRFLPRLYEAYLSWDSRFDGFIIQTTASQLLKLDDDFLLASGIRYVELGVESYNNEILRVMNKPATEKTIQAAVDKLKRLGIKVIANIMIGLPGENKYTYANTINWLYNNIAAISHMNVYTYVDYSDTDSKDENRGGDSELDKSFAAAIYDFGNEALDEGITWTSK